MRRSAIKQEMKERIDKTRLDLTEQLRKHFSHEVDINERKMRELIMPYRYICCLNYIINYCLFLVDLSKVNKKN